MSPRTISLETKSGGSSLSNPELALDNQQIRPCLPPNKERQFHIELYDSAEVDALLFRDDPMLQGRTWVLSFSDSETKSTLMIGMNVEPRFVDCSELSGFEKIVVWGGFRILPPSDASDSWVTQLTTAARLSREMSGKAEYVTSLGLGGPLTKAFLSNSGQLVGGKCVFKPGLGCAVGEPGDVMAMQFAIDCLNWLTEHSQLTNVTGQDTGHGMLSIGEDSLNFLGRNASQSAKVVTAIPTGLGEYHLLCGIASANNVELDRCRISAIGCGGVGGTVISKLIDHQGAVIAATERQAKHAALQKEYGDRVRLLEPSCQLKLLDHKPHFLLVNGNGGSLSDDFVNEIVEQKRAGRIPLLAIIGAENMMFSGGHRKDLIIELASADIQFYPGQLVGVWGGLAALEQSLAKQLGQDFSEADFEKHTKSHFDIGREIATALQNKGKGYTVEDLVAIRYRRRSRADGASLEGANDTDSAGML